MNLDSFTFGLSIYVVVITFGYHFLRLGFIMRNTRLLVIGFVILLSSIIIPPLFLSSQIEFLINSLALLVGKYPILHLLFWTVTSIIIVPLFVDVIKEAEMLTSKEAERVIGIGMGLMASTSGYIFSIIFISIASATIAALLLSIFVASIISTKALADSKDYRRKNYVEERSNKL